MKEVPLSQGMVTLVDDEDYDRVSQYKWFYQNQGYAIRNPSKLKNGLKVKMMHRFIMNCPQDKYVDHIDGDKLNNQKSNLRICTHAENDRNVGISKNSTSGYKGVTWCKERNKWQAQIMYNRKHVHAGRFSNKEDAAKAYDRKAIELFGEFAKLNFDRSNYE